MSTRSFTIFEGDIEYFTENVSGELCRFYRHCDGYPEGHGLCMAVAAVDAIASGRANNRNMASAIIGGLWANGSVIEFETADSAPHGDLEYIYLVSIHSDYTGGKLRATDDAGVNIAVYSIGWDEPYSVALSREPIFSGTPTEYIRHYKRELRDWHLEGCVSSTEDFMRLVFPNGCEDNA